MKISRVKLIVFMVGVVLLGLLAIAVYFQQVDTKTNESGQTKEKINKQNGSETTKEDSIKPEEIEILIIDKTNNIEIKNTPVELLSNDGTRCIQSPCPMNEKTWTGTTDSNGFLRVPRELMQAETTLQPYGYGFASIPYDQSISTYTLVFIKQ